MTDTVSFKDILFVSRRWPDRGEKTSYEYFLNYFEGADFVLMEDRIQSPYRILKAAGTLTGHKTYTSISAGMELATFLRMIKKRPKAIHFMYGDYDLFYIAYLAKCFRIPLFATFHNPPSELYRRIKKRSYLKYLKGVVLLGGNQEKFFEEVCPDVPRTLIPLGVDTDYFKPATDKVRRKKQVLILGVHLRNWEMIRAFISKIRNQDPTIQIRTVIDARNVHEIPLSEHVFNTHPLTDEELRECYTESSCMLYYPTDCVGSNAVVEAAACGLPTIAPDTGAIKEYISQEAHFIFEPDDVNGMVGAAIELCQNTIKREGLEKKIRCEIFRLDWRRIREMYIKFYQNTGVIK